MDGLRATALVEKNEHVRGFCDGQSGAHGVSP
jgi:hypothetical protein